MRAAAKKTKFIMAVGSSDASEDAPAADDTDAAGEWL
jgi:hypothetical protein